jgi:RNA polymerase-binding transcription factor DksA
MLGEQEFTMKDSDMLEPIGNAQARLEEVMYGRCVECAHDIADRRLRLRMPPSAMRCEACEQRYKQLGSHSDRLAPRRHRLSLFSDVVSV